MDRISLAAKKCPTDSSIKFHVGGVTPQWKAIATYENGDCSNISVKLANSRASRWYTVTISSTEQSPSPMYLSTTNHVRVIFTECSLGELQIIISAIALR